MSTDKYAYVSCEAVDCPGCCIHCHSTQCVDPYGGQEVSDVDSVPVVIAAGREDRPLRIKRPGGPIGKRDEPQRWHKIDQWWKEFERFFITKGPSEMALMMANHGDRDFLTCKKLQFFITPKRNREDACGMLCQITGLVHSFPSHEGWEIRGFALVNGTGDPDAAREFTGFYNHKTRLGSLTFK